MSLEAMNWAWKQPVPISSAKFTLLALANRANPDQRGRIVAFPSIAYLAEVTSQDRKTVLANLAKLATWGLISATGDRVGRTNQVPVYELKCPPDLFTEQTQKRNSSKSGTVPKTRVKSPVFPAEQSQKRDTDSALDSVSIPKSGIGTANSQSGRLPPAAEVLAKSRPRKLASQAAVDAAREALALGATA